MKDIINIPITILSDEKGYLDRECPNKNCLYNFKVLMEDWQNKVSDEEVHCPMCGHIDTSDKWWTQKQLDDMEEIASNWAMDYLFNEIGKTFKNLERETKNNKFVKFKYKPERKVSFINNPIGQSEEWELDIECEKCGTHYSVIGSAYFCPCCGYNSVETVLDESLDTIKKMIDSIPKMKEMLSKNYGLDKSDTMCRIMLEGTLGEIVSAFQKFAEMKFRTISSTNVRVNDFQIIEKGSDLFKSACGKGYDEWLSNDELEIMNIYFQRRHLIEHNNGIVDQKYIDKSQDNTYFVGQRIVVKEKDAKKLLEIVMKLSNGLKEI